MVHDADQTVGRLSRREGRTALALIGCAALLAGCGGSPTAAPKPVATGSVATVRQADCGDWQAGNPAQRRSTVTVLRKFAGGPVVFRTAERQGLVLDDRRAYKILDRTCSQYFARGFKLYKLYGRAATLIGNRPKPAPDL